MKIHIKSKEQNLRIRIPTGLVFSPLGARFICRYGLQYAGDAMKDLSPEALSALFAEFRRIKKKHGSWELVNIESSDGDLVKVTL